MMLFCCAAVRHASAGEFDLPAAVLSVSFGSNVVALPNGNFVVTDPACAGGDGSIPFVGAIYLFDGTSLAVISTLTGNLPGDRVGSGGITLLSNGNYVVNSPFWHNNGFGSVLGAVTWCSPATGVNGAVSAANSLVGDGTGTSYVGLGGVTAMNNGNYVVSSPRWHTDTGAATWGNGLTGVTGVVSSANSLVGSTRNDRVGLSITVLKNSNYVVSSTNWNTSTATNVGAVTWGSGTTGVTGAVSAANSLVGSTAHDRVGSSVTVLNNGNYVVSSTNWNNGTATNAGAVTWGNGTNGVSGMISLANSLVGSRTNDHVGLFGVTALTGGNYVVCSPNWSNGTATNVGAVTWGNGTNGVSGTISAANSLVGSQNNDRVGFFGVTTLNNGNYVVNSSFWNNGTATIAGAVTWGNGATGVAGAVSSTNSLVGGTANDRIGSTTFIPFRGVTPLNNGNYVVCSPNWNNSAGAVTWGNGAGGVTGAISSSNSLVGNSGFIPDEVGFQGVIPLNNGNYVVSSPSWHTNSGAVTWGNGTTGVTGAVSPTNSLVGTRDDNVGDNGITPLNNGNYVVQSPAWQTLRGAATWGNGTTGTTGIVSSANSLVGSTAGSSPDQVGIFVTALSNGNYVVNSPIWNNTAATNAGAVTWGNGTTGTEGVVSPANSLVGSTDNDSVGTPLLFDFIAGGPALSNGVIALNNGNYIVSSVNWSTFRGAVTWGNGTTGVTGAVSPANSLVGTSNSFDEVGLVDGANNGVAILNDGNYVLINTNWRGGQGAVSLGDGTAGTTDPVSTSNSVLGRTAGNVTPVFSYDLTKGRLLVGFPNANRVSLLGYTPQLLVQQPLNLNLTNGSTKILGAPSGQQASLTFSIQNINLGRALLSGITIDGPEAASFAISTNPAPSLDFGNSTTFTVQFTPSTGTNSAALHINSNDPHENPFNINLTGQVLTFTQDTDGDGLSDAEEFFLAPLGFDWQVSQPALVSTLFSNANGAGLFTTNQIEALNVGTPLLVKDPQSGEFTLTIGVQKSTNLVQFFPFPMTAPQTMIDGQGNLQFQFSSGDNAAFFRLEAH
jgi:hypothetical protein